MRTKLLVSLGLLATAASAFAFDVRITIENATSQDPLGLHFGPVWLGFHDGTFDLFDPGSAASLPIERLAELGDSSLVNSWFSSVQPTGQSLVANNPGGPGPGLYTPGASRSLTVNLDPTTQRFLSFGTMVVPSNDSFFANANPTLLQLFDDSGAFLGAHTWSLTGLNVWDAGTEVNHPLLGAAFVAGVDATLGESEGGTIQLQSLHGLDDSIGLTTPAGTVIGRALGEDAFLRISVAPVPEPSTYGMIGALGLVGLAVVRRRTRKTTAKI
jgi:PEP-CTERM motif/Spondin_N